VRVAFAARAPLLTTGLLLCLAVTGVAYAGGHGRTHVTSFHVAPWGDDRSPGTAKRPFATLERAQHAVRAGAVRMRGDVVVNLHPGLHELDRPLQLSWRDSGRNGHQVIYQALGYGTPAQGPAVVSGGRRIAGWRLHDSSAGIWRAQVGDLETRQLFVDGRRARRAELGSVLPGEWSLTPQGYVTDSTAPQSWENPEDIEIALKWKWYNEPRCGVESISGDSETTTITMEQPCFGWARDLFSGQFADFPPLTLAFLPPFPENSKSFLTQPGTFYLDRSRPGHHVLFYMPRPGEDMRRARVVAPVLEELVTGEGVRDVTFRGLTFADTTWLAPNEPTGFVQFFAGLYEGGNPPLDDDPFNVSEDARSMPGSLRFHGSRRIVFERNRFTRLGANGLELSLGSHENVVRGNVFTDISGGGVEVGNRYPGDGDQVNRDNRIESNWVHAIGADYPGSVGIYTEMTQEMTVAHNQVNGVPYSGIVFGQYWLQEPDTLNRGTRILENHVFDTLNDMSDGGGIWTAAPQGPSFERGALVRGNWTTTTSGWTAAGSGSTPTTAATT
jgi:hypothetical protein